MADATTATASQPWFTVGPQDGAGQGLSLTTQRTALNEQTTGVANDLVGQSDDTTTALQAIADALNNKPGE